MNVICVNCKEVFALPPDRCKHCGGQTFEETHAAVYPKDTGTIAWYNCTDSLPPLVEPEYTFSYFSKEVLTTDGQKIKAVMYHYTSDNEPLGWACPASYTPTHWAYINYPEPVQD